MDSGKTKHIFNYECIKLFEKVQDACYQIIEGGNKMALSPVECYRNMGVKIGENVNIYDTYIDNGHPYLCEIGNNVTLSLCYILTHGASMHTETGYSKIGKVIIGNNVFVGFKSIILCNVHIGDDVIIVAGGVVTKDIPSNCVVAGNPARVIGRYDEYIKKHRENLKTHHVSHTYWKQKPNTEKLAEVAALTDTFGYDV